MLYGDTDTFAGNSQAPMYKITSGRIDLVFIEHRRLPPTLRLST